MTIDTYNMTISLTYYVIQYYIYYCILNIFMYKQYLWALGVILFGNGKRMKIVDCHDHLDVFLDNRVDILQECLISSSGWKSSLVL